MKHVESQSDMPPDTHFAVLVFSSRHVPGDERSIDCPGHGYPAHSEPVVKYIAFGSQDALAQWVKEEGDRKPFTVIQVTPKKLKTRLEVTLT